MRACEVGRGQKADCRQSRETEDGRGFVNGYLVSGETDDGETHAVEDCSGQKADCRQKTGDDWRKSELGW